MRQKKIQGLLIITTFNIAVLLFTFTCFSQDNNSNKKKLVVEKTFIKGWKTKPTRATFNVYDRITVERFSNDSLIRGKIETITDSTIIIKSKKILTSDIKRINAIRGVVPTIIGLPILLPSALLFISVTLTKSPGTDYGDEFLPTVGLFIGGIFTIIGVLELATIKHYYIGKDWKIMVISKIK